MTQQNKRIPLRDNYNRYNLFDFWQFRLEFNIPHPMPHRHWQASFQLIRDLDKEKDYSLCLQTTADSTLMRKNMQWKEWPAIDCFNDIWVWCVCETHYKLRLHLWCICEIIYPILSLQKSCEFISSQCRVRTSSKGLVKVISFFRTRHFEKYFISLTRKTNCSLRVYTFNRFKLTSDIE